MNGRQLVEELRGVQFLQGVADEHVQQLALVARPLEYESGALIFREGDEARHVYLVVAGTVSLEICGPGTGCRRILTVSAGDLLGWSPLVGESRLMASARALSPTRVFEIDAGQVLAICEHDTRFGFELMRRAALALAHRLNATRLQLLDVYGTEMPSTPT